jgi:hypothetical protein
MTRLSRAARAVQEPDRASEPARVPEPDRVPIFGSWRAIHTAVILCAVLTILLLALFSRWPF